MKKVKKLVAFALMLCMMAPVAMAVQNETGAPEISAYAWDQLLATSNTFDIAADGAATMIATTGGVSNSTKVTVKMTLQKKVNGAWTNVSGMSWSSSVTDTNYVSLDKLRWVDKGYNYRMQSVHTATGPNGTETDTINSVIIYYGN